MATSTPVPVSRYTTAFKPLTQISPTTFRNGYTFLELYENLKSFLLDVLTPELDAKLKLIYEETQREVDRLAGIITDKEQEWQDAFNLFMDNVIEELEALNDQAMGNLIQNPTSATRTELDKLYATKAALAAYQLTTNAAIATLQETVLYKDELRVHEWLVFYISPTGVDTNDGLSPGSPRKTINKIIADTQNNFYDAGVGVQIHGAAGTYPENVRFENMPGEIKNYVISGPVVAHPGVPQMIFSQGMGSGTSGILARNPALDLTVEYVKFIGYDGNASAGGIVLADSKLTTKNVHAERCYWGITGSRAVLNIPDGVFNNNGRVNGLTGSGAGIRSLMLTNHAIGNQYGNVANSTIFTNNIYGFLAQESSVGHVDNSTFESNDYGLVARVNSRANAGGSVFRNNVTGITSTGNSYVLISSDTFTAEPNSNGTNIVARLGGVVSMSTFDAYVGDVDISMSIAPRRVVGAYDRIQHTGPSDYVFDRVLKAGFWNDNASSRRPAKKVQLRVRGTVSGTTASKTIGVRLGVTANNASVSAVIPANVTGAIDMTFDLIMRAPSDQYMSMNTAVGSTVIVSDAISTVDMNSDRQLRVSLSTSSATDIFVINAIELYIEG